MIDEHELRALVMNVRRGRLSRRAFTRLLATLGITGSAAAHLLGAAGHTNAQGPRAHAPSRRGGGGELRLIYWQAPVILNPHLALGVKDRDAARIFYEPLAAYDQAGGLVPVLASEIPSVEGGGVARDGLSVTWRLKRGVTWHDGRPFTADDVVFTWEYAADPASAAISGGLYREIARIEKLDSHSVKLVFSRPTPSWTLYFCGSAGEILPKHVFEPFRTRAREAPANLKPLGTGPYRIVDFKPGDILRAEINTAYHVSNRPFFDRLELKGGGDAVSAARAVLQTGQYDFASNPAVEDDILQRLEQGGKGRVDIAPGATVERILFNFSDPWADVDGERSSPKTTHPLLGDSAVREAMTLLVDRAAIVAEIYGRQGETTPNFLNAPARYRSPNTRWEFSVDKANQRLDAAGWRRGPDGVRARDGKRLRLVFQTTINAPRQKVQAIVKQACARAGVDIEVKAVVASVFFSADPGNNDTYNKFYADLQMESPPAGSPDPLRRMAAFHSRGIASKDNRWSGGNVTRWRNEEYDRLWDAAETELDLAKRTAMFIRMNDLLVQHPVLIPVLLRHVLSAAGAKLRGTNIGPWDSVLWQLPYWYRET